MAWCRRRDDPDCGSRWWTVETDGRLPHREHAELHARSLLQIADHAEKILGLRVTAGPEHADQAFGRRASCGPEFFEADGRLDVVAQDRLSGLQVTGEHRIDSLAQQRLREFLVILDVALDQFLETS